MILKWLNEIRKNEKKITYGKENPELNFYVFGHNDIRGGLFWLINKTLMHLAYALDKKYIMIVDLQNYHNQYIRSKDFRKKNMWEYYFEQPMGWTLNDIKRSKNIIKSRLDATPNDKYYMGQFYNDQERINYFRRLFNAYIKPNIYTIKYIEDEYNKIIKGKGRVLGVLCRGTDYTKNRPQNHPIQPTPEEMIKKAMQIMMDYKCDYLYLSTEDSDIVDKFDLAFSNKLLINNQNRISSKELRKSEWIANTNKRKKEDTYLKGLQYYSSINLLSKCTCFLGGRTGGTKGVLLMSQGFEYQYIFDLGYY